MLKLMRRIRRVRPVLPPRLAFTGFRFPREVIVLAVRWYLRYGLSYRDVEELLAERGVQVDHVTVFQWVQRFTPLLIDVARPCRHVPGDRWFADETYIKVAGRWVYLYRAIDQFGQVIDVLISQKRGAWRPPADSSPAPWSTGRPRPRSSPTRQRSTHPSWMNSPRAPGTTPSSTPATGSNPDHGRVKSRLRPMRGLKQLRCARVISAGHAFIQNLRRGHYELGTEEPTTLRMVAAFTELAMAI
jgi:transposase, IS6 family